MRALFLIFFLALASALPAAGQPSIAGAAGELLPPEKAFRFSARVVDGTAVEVRFAIAEGYYLYRERFGFSAEGGSSVRLGAPELPPGKRHRDEFFGEVETYRKEVVARLPVEGSGRLNLKVTSQGCADSGVCYVPMDSHATLRVGAAAGDSGPEPSFFWSLFASDLDIARLFEGNLALVLASFVAFGVLLAFTPCVLPMVPILSGIIAGEGRSLTKLRALILSVAYVLGMAATYAAAGVAAALSGTILAAALQSPWVLGAFALVFVVLALSMFGLYDLQLPGFLHHRLHAAHRRLQGGRVASVAAMGAFSAVIVSPCVAAPLAGALLYISQSQDIALGAAALFALALGMGLPLIVVGVSEGAFLPKAGPWMNGVRKFFGVLLLGVAVWIVSPVIPAAAQMLAWAALAIGSGVYLRALDPLPQAAGGWWRVSKAGGVMLLLAGASMLVGALAGSRDPLRPLAGVLSSEGPSASTTGWTRIGTMAELDRHLKAPGKLVMLDFYADWCVSCKEMEAFTFSDPRVRAKLNDMLRLQVDVTANTPEHRAMLKRFSLFGPPGIIFFDRDGRELKGLRVIGYQNGDRFLRTLALAEAP